MATTLKDIARETGLSVATISKYVNGVPLKEKNRAAVERAIKKLGYTANEYARGLKSNSSRSVGVIIPELSNLFITRIIARMEELLRESGYSVLICDCHTDEKLECEAVRFLLGKMVDGMISMPVCRDGRHLKPVIESGRHVVLLDRAVPELSGTADCVLIDNEAAAYTATKLLLENGHRKIGIIVGPADIFTSYHRLAGYRRALEKFGGCADDALIEYSDYTLEGGFRSMKCLLERDADMTAALVTNNEMTLGAIIALNERQVRIPDELSFIGFDNLEMSRITHPVLTIVSQPLDDIGSCAARLILDRLGKKRTGAPVSVTLGAELISGASVRDIRAL